MVLIGLLLGVKNPELHYCGPMSQSTLQKTQPKKKDKKKNTYYRKSTPGKNLQKAPYKNAPYEESTMQKGTKFFGGFGL